MFVVHTLVVTIVLYILTHYMKILAWNLLNAHNVGGVFLPNFLDSSQFLQLTEEIQRCILYNHNVADPHTAVLDWG